ncbi:MAG: pyridoxamine 5'-phosphate oxidase family protein [Acaryochloris sp. RU_4_1]|nr:pyridoxamine 5'-phosphate oxidase family protein [Acaryochloris sp. SU_5_25]NJM65128.1 pyridoxamine 5'-phosphate oxidase family protein [Acaryochloris sp. RU_4_1]NJN38037.1 pyridoxamine 5'-phosphate oxidase family protein [Acaryochloridaceae cyanobacterium CSU_3_4]NJR54068.1 pyridoxamine 5'-phosphate oxidase family protein [Acaryochloris sp. CRU_2_0]
MAKFYPELTSTLQAFIAQQQIFFTASAPTQGRINLSPKGMSTFRCISPQAVAYLDLTGSGNETSAHIAENGRLTIMFCSFVGEPLILRLYGQGEVVRPRDRTWSHWLAYFEELPGTRQIVVLHIESVQTSCGFGVPLYEYQGNRDRLIHWATQKGSAGLQTYQHQNNQVSIDGYPTDLFAG